jgi:hypothetical protein
VGRVEERWLTLYQADYSTRSRIRWLKGLSIGTAAIVPWLIIAAVVYTVVQW